MKNNHYHTVKALIECGHITGFRQIFDHISKTSVEKRMGIHPHRFDKIIKDVTWLRVKEVYILSNLFGVEVTKIFELINNQHKNHMKVAPKK